MKTIKQHLRSLVRFVRETKAVSALEYAILVGVIAVAVGAALATFGTNITATVEKVGKNIIAEHADKGSSPSPSPSPSP